MKRSTLFVGLLLLVSLCLALEAAPFRRRPGVPPPPGAAGGLDFSVAETTTPDSGAESLPAAKTGPLSAAEVEKVLARLPRLAASPGDKQALALRPATSPPPQTGRQVKTVFPPLQASAPPVTGPSGPLEVLRHGPEGPVSIAPALTVTFSQPMVPLSSLDAVEGQVPAVLSPAPPPGKWRWLGTRTLEFAPQGRFPMATQWRITIPAGIESQTHGRLAQETSWTFTTPPPQLVASTPGGNSVDVNPVLVAVFDQAVHPQDVLSTIHLTAGGAEVPLRLATEAEVKSDEAASAELKTAMQGRWVAFRATSALPVATSCHVAIGPGTPSAEGPDLTAATQGFDFNTYGPLRIEDYTSREGEPVNPAQPWYLQFSNPLQDVPASSLRVTPDVPGLKVDFGGQGVTLRGVFAGRTDYTVTVDTTVRDAYRQTMNAPQSVTIRVGSAPAQLAAQGGPLVIIDPDAGPHYSVYTINEAALKVRLYAESVDDWNGMVPFMQHFQDDVPPTPPGHLEYSGAVTPARHPDTLVETPIDLTPALKSGFGQVLLVVEPAVKTENSWQERPIVAWIQVTHIGLDAVVDTQRMVGWATALHNGAPLSGVQLSLGTATANTDDKGLASLDLPTAAHSRTLVARRGDDLAFLPQNSSWWGGDGWYRQPQHDTLQWFLFDDRKMYRPGETVHVKGWLRRLGAGPHGDVEGLQGVDSIRYTVTAAQGHEILKGTCHADALGGFEVTVPLPANVNLGSATILFTAATSAALQGLEASHSFEIQEFRRPEFEVSAKAGSETAFVGEHGTVSLDAHYYAGGGLAGAPVAWNLYSTPTSYAPPKNDGYSFGTWIPWWSFSDFEGSPTARSTSRSLQGRTDAAGHDTIRLDFAGVTPPRPVSVRAEGTVSDLNRQAWTGTATILVHPSHVYVGLKSSRTFVQAGETFDIDTVAVDVDGRRLTGRPVRLRLVRLDWKSDDKGYHSVEVDEQIQSVTSTAGPVRVQFKTGEGGTYRLVATTTDDKGHPNESELTLWVAGGKTRPERSLKQQAVTLIPDRREYAGGDTAAVLVQAPFVPAEGLLTIARSGIIEVRPFHVDTATTTLKIPIDDSYTPDVTVQVDMVGAAPRTNDAGDIDTRLGTRPAYATGDLSLSVPPTRRALTMTAEPHEKALSPGASTWIDVHLEDAAHHPVRGEVAVVVVDEAILALSGYSLPNPMDFFYSGRGSGISACHSRDSVLLSNPNDILQRGGANGAIATMEAQAIPPPPPPAPGGSPHRGLYKSVERKKSPAIALRTNMSALALFAPHVETDAQGHARVPFKLPDNLTRYRIMAVAVAGTRQFGSASSALTARLPLMVRPSPPRFLNFGDRFELPVVVQNQTDAPMTVAVAVRGTNLQWPDGVGRKVVVPANNRVEVRFPARTVEAGTARFQVAAASTSEADAASLSLPVWTPATTEAFATYGVVDSADPVVQPVQAPPNVFPQFGGLDVTTSSTALASLTDAMLYLQSYPFECAEQLSSRVLSVAALRDVLTAFQAPGLPSARDMESAMARDIERLQGMQNADGGFGFWHQGEASWPYISIHVAHALVVARSKGYRVSATTLQASQSYLRTIDKHIPDWYGPNCRRALIAYALNVRALMGDDDAEQARHLVDEAGASHLPIEAMAWVLPILSRDPASATQVSDLLRALDNQVTETAADANYTVSYEDGEHLLLASDRRADAVVLDALIQAAPQRDVISKLVAGLLDHRQRGRWGNTQENVFILLALDRYFQTYEKVAPDFVARIWLGQQAAGDHHFVGHTTERHEVDVPMQWLAEHAGTQDLTLSKTGPGRLYYRMGMRYAPRNLAMPPTDEGFSVQRRYESVDTPADVRRDADGTWRIKAGARVRIDLTLVASNRRYHVALVDPLPAGLESMNPELQVTGTVPQRPDEMGHRPYGWWWSDSWFEHQNLRDDRTEAFTSLLWEGVYHYSYVARATTPGTFVVPPTKAEEMYHPETFGRSASDRVVVQ